MDETTKLRELANKVYVDGEARDVEEYARELDDEPAYFVLRSIDPKTNALVYTVLGFPRLFLLGGGIELMMQALMSHYEDAVIAATTRETLKAVAEQGQPAVFDALAGKGLNA